MNIQLFWKEHKVFIVGLLYAIFMSAYEVISKGDNFSWWVIGWSVFVAGTTFAGKNVRGQWASIFATIGTSTYAFFTLHNSPEGLTLQMFVRDLVFPMLIQTLGVFNIGPSKPREYENSSPIVEAKLEANEMKEEKKSQ